MTRPRAFARPVAPTTVSSHRVIVQCRGKFNARPMPQDIDMLRRWATAERLQISAHVR